MAEPREAEIEADEESIRTAVAKATWPPGTTVSFGGISAIEVMGETDVAARFEVRTRHVFGLHSPERELIGDQIAHIVDTWAATSVAIVTRWKEAS
jgi:hypothetical protein